MKHISLQIEENLLESFDKIIKSANKENLASYINRSAVLREFIVKYIKDNRKADFKDEDRYVANLRKKEKIIIEQKKI